MENQLVRYLKMTVVWYLMEQIPVLSIWYTDYHKQGQTYYEMQ